METKILYFICEGVTEVALITKILEKNNLQSSPSDKEENKNLILFDLSSQKNIKIYELCQNTHDSSTRRVLVVR